MANRGVSRLTGIVLAASALFGGSGCIGVGMVGRTSNGTPVYWNMNVPVPVDASENVHPNSPNNKIIYGDKEGETESVKNKKMGLSGSDIYTGETIVRGGYLYPHGKGTYLFVRNDIVIGSHDGHFSFGKREGLGTYIEAGKIRGEGYWHNDKWVGETKEDYDRALKADDEVANTKQG
jgi:hypothetical protein